MTDTKTEKELLLSPKGELIFSKLQTPTKNAFTGNMEYSVRMEIDGDAHGAQAFKTALKKINKALIITEDKEGNSVIKKEGNFVINARTKSEYKPVIFDTDNTTIPTDEVPMLGKGSIVRVQLTPFDGKKGKGGGVNLESVQLLDVVEYQGKEAIDEDVLRSKLSKLG